MAECKDCVHSKVCSEVNSLKCRKDFIWYDAKSGGCPYYTADVVPKSEVEELKKDRYQILPDGRIELIPRSDVVALKKENERLQNILDSYALQYGTVMDKYTVIEKERAEVAREFIEAVDSMLELVCAMTGLELTFFGKYAELKKKYAEEKKDEFKS